MNSTMVFRHAPGVRWREFGSDGILLDPESGDYLQINDIGVLIWKSLDPPGTLEDVIERVTAHFDDLEEQAAADIREFVTGLAERRFVLVNVRS